MYHSNHTNNNIHGTIPFSMVNSHDQPEIKEVDVIHDHHKNLLKLLITGNLSGHNEINAFIKGSKLILESYVNLYDDYAPVRTHLIGRDIIDEALEGRQYIGFHEINLKQGYHYEILSSQVMNPGLLKIILRCSRLNKQEKSKQIN